MGLRLAPVALVAILLGGSLIAEYLDHLPVPVEEREQLVASREPREPDPYAADDSDSHPVTVDGTGFAQQHATHWQAGRDANLPVKSATMNPADPVVALNTISFRQPLSSSTHRYTALAPVPMPSRSAHEGASVMHHGELWIIAGFPPSLPAPDLNGGMHTNVWRYKPSLNEWSPGPPTLGQFINHIFGCAFSTSQGILVVGGLTTGSSSAAVLGNPHQYFLNTSDPDEAQWAWKRAPVPEGLLSGVAACTRRPHVDPQTGNLEFYVLSGSLTNFGVNDTIRFCKVVLSPAGGLAQTFEVLASPSEEIYSHHVHIFFDTKRRRILATPGRDSSFRSKFIMIQFSLDSMTWSVAASLPPSYPFFEGQGFYQDPSEKFLLLFGGQDHRTGSVSEHIHRIDFDASTGEPSWTLWGALPVAVSASFLEPVTPTPNHAGVVSIILTMGQGCMGLNAIPDTWRIDIMPKPDPAVLASSLSIPHCFDDNGCPSGSEAAARHIAAAVQVVRGRLIVLSALYGPTQVGVDIQAMIDAGIRMVHFDPEFAAFTRVVPEVRYLGDLVNWFPMTGSGDERDVVRRAISITLLEVPPGLPPFIRTVWCPMVYSCRFY